MTPASQTADAGQPAGQAANGEGAQSTPAGEGTSSSGTPTGQVDVQAPQRRLDLQGRHYYKMLMESPFPSRVVPFTLKTIKMRKQILEDGEAVKAA